MAEAPDVEQQPPQQPPQPPPLKELTPYSKEAEKQIRQFYKKRASNPGAYSYDAKGNLQGPDGIINLLRFTPIDPAYRDAQEQMRLDQIGKLENDLVAAGGSLREAHASGDIPAILRANQAVADLEVQRTATRSAIRTFISIGNPVTRDILLDQPYETRKLVYVKTTPYQYYNPDIEPAKVKDPFDKQVVQMVYRDFPPTRFYGHYVPDEAVPAAAAAAAPEEIFRQTLKDGRRARIIFETDDTVNGFMSPMWPVEFVMKETRYYTAIQAYEAERARELGNEPLRTQLLKTRSARTIRILVQKITDHPVDAKGLWLEIYTAIYQQHPELMAKLMETGTDAIVYADARPGPSGAGVSDKSPAILDPAQWKGENAAGLAQETVRSRAREETLDEAPVGDVAEGVISEEEQRAARVGAIINSKRQR